MFPSLAAWGTYVAETNFAARKQKMFLPEVKNIFASRTQILRPSETHVSQFSHHENNVDSVPVLLARNWKDEEIEMLITLYEERPRLWDVGHKDYMNRDSKEAAVHARKSIY